MCDMMVPRRSLNRVHRRTAQCRKVVERKSWRLAVEEERAVTSRVFRAYGLPLEMVTSFRYLGQLISAADDDWKEVVSNLSRAREVWKRMKRILSM